MQAQAYRCIEYSWAAVGVVWLVSALASKRTARSETAGSRLWHIATMTAAFGLFFSTGLPLGPLGWRIVPDSPAFVWVGLALTVAGCAFAIWVRLLLGSNWSASVTVKQDHRLIRRGPYTIVRHPIYTGFLLGLLGTALAIGEWRGIAGLVLAFAGWRKKSRLEETLMLAQFGTEYIAYERDVKARIPFVL